MVEESNKIRGKKSFQKGGIIGVVLIIFVLSVSIAQSGQSTSTKNMIFKIEYQKPVAKVQTLQVIFYVKVTAQQAEDILRDAMALAIKTIPPTVEILGNAWDSNENMMSLTNGKNHISYNPKTKKYTAF